MQCSGWDNTLERHVEIALKMRRRDCEAALNQQAGRRSPQSAYRTLTAPDSIEWWERREGHCLPTARLRCKRGRRADVASCTAFGSICPTFLFFFFFFFRRGRGKASIRRKRFWQSALATSDEIRFPADNTLLKRNALRRFEPRQISRISSHPLCLLCLHMSRFQRRILWRNISGETGSRLWK